MSRRTQVSSQQIPRISMGTAFMYGCGAGVIGVVAMTISQKIEQSITSRPSSLVPGYTLQRLLGLTPRPEDEMFTLNMAMHYGQGIMVGGVRGIMSLWGIRGPMADFMFTGLRILTDQTLENWTGVGALPWTWPVQEQVIDIIHKAIYAYTTGYVMDNFVH